MAIEISCPDCKLASSAPDSLAGDMVRCPGCKRPIVVPSRLAPVDVNLFDISGAPPDAQSALAFLAKFPQPALHPAAALPYSPQESMRLAARLGRSRTAHSRRYLFFVLAIAPLFLMAFANKNDTKTRIQTTLQKHPEVIERMRSLAQASRYNTHFSPDVDRNLLELLPDKKIEGALLAHDSLMHWGYAALSAGLFALLLWALFPRGNASLGDATFVAFLTSTVGVSCLLVFHIIANATGGLGALGAFSRGRWNWPVALILLFFKFISYSYRVAHDPQVGFLASFIGFTFGVGMCEELCKALPVVFRFRMQPPLDHRGACFWGLASGAGFGIAEGIMYAANAYNGLATAPIYLVRFVACVALHATWTASVAMMIWWLRNYWDFFASRWEWWHRVLQMALYLLLVLAVPMTLHGLYDTLLKKDMIFESVIAAMASLTWLAILIEMTQASSQQTNDSQEN